MDYAGIDSMDRQSWLPFIVVGDLHLRISDLGKAKAFFSFLESKMQTMSEKPTLVLLGDVYDVKSIIRVEVQNFFYEELTRLSKVAKRIVLLVGNHDYTNKNLVDHAFRFPCDKMIPNLIVVDKPTRLSRQCVAMPYYESGEQFVVHFKELCGQASETRLLFCHQGFNGFFYNSYQQAEKNGVQASELGFKPDIRVIAGHFHCYQESGSIMYLGTPYAHSFGEANQEKKILEIDSDHSYRLLPVDASIPKYWMFQTSLEELLSGQIDVEYTAIDFVKFLIKDTEENCQKVTKNFLQSLMKEGKLPTTEQLYVQYEYRVRDSMPMINEHLSAVDMFREYVLTYFKDHPQKEFILDVGQKSYLEKAL